MDSSATLREDPQGNAMVAQALKDDPHLGLTAGCGLALMQ